MPAYEPTAADYLSHYADLAAHADDPSDTEARRAAEAAAIAELDAWVEQQAREQADESVIHDAECGGWANEDDVPEAA